jgi:hypothetical protein
LTPFTGVKV